MLPMLLMAGSTIMGAVSAKKAGEAQAAESRRAAIMARIAGRQRARELRDDGQQFAGQQMASYAKAGVLFDSGSPLLAVMDTVHKAETNALRAEQGGFESSRALTVQGQTQASAANSAALAGLLQGAGSAMSMYGKAQAGAYKPPSS